MLRHVFGCKCPYLGLLPRYPPRKKNSDFIKETFHGSSTRGRMSYEKNKRVLCLLACKGRSRTMTSGGGGKGHRFSGKTSRELVSKPATSFEEKLGWATAVRLLDWSEKDYLVSGLRSVPVSRYSACGIRRTSPRPSNGHM